MPSKAFITLTVALLISSLTACMQDVNSQLVEAGRQGDARNIEGLLAAGAEVDAKDEKDITALLYASSEGHSASVEALLDAGADVDAQANDGMTALMVVAKGNDGWGDPSDGGCPTRKLFPSWRRVRTWMPLPIMGSLLG